MIRTEELDFILSPAGRAVLDEVAASPLTPDSRLATVGLLRERLGRDNARAVVEMALLRQRAVRKFSRAGCMFFSRDGLEQATAEAVATHRASRYIAAGMGRVADMGCGIGGDALALATAGCEVLAIDREYVHVALARENAAVYDAGDNVWPLLADLLELPPPPVDAFFFDPARRTPTGPRLAAARRLRSVDEYRPPLSLIDTWRPRIPNGAVKVSPGIDYNQLPPDAEVEFVSLGGEVKEAVLWFGALRSDAGRRATVLPAGVTLTDRDEGMVEVGPVRACLYEPDGAVIRAHLVGQLAFQIGATLIDPEIAYLSTDAPVTTTFATGYRIEDHFPFQLKRLRQALRDRDVGTVTIKKRGSPLDPDTLRQSLRLRGKAHCFVFLTQVAGRHTAMVAEPLT